MLRKLALPFIAAVAAACVDPSAADYDGVGHEGLVLSLAAGPTAIAPRDSARLVARLANHNQHSVRLDFSSGCQILPYVESAGGKTVYPHGGGWMCTAVLTSLELAPGEVKEQTLKWTGQSHGYDRTTFAPIYSPLPAGEYRAFAVLNGSLNGERVALRSNTEKVTVR